MTARSLAVRLLGAVLAACLIVGAGLGAVRLSGNFHTVVPGELYRSAQLTPARLSDYSQGAGIRTVVNLRGAHPGTGWYDAEVAAARALGLAHFDFGMSASEQLPEARARELLELFRRAPKPILIHCQGGADRSGLAAALYLAAIANAGEERAESQMSLRYGHIGVPYLSAAYPMDESWEALEPWLGFMGS